MIAQARNHLGHVAIERLVILIDLDARLVLLAHGVPIERVLFEAPTKSSQAWFVKHFGPNVNLGNIPPDEVIPLETLRLGLRGDTLKEVLLTSVPERD